MSCFGEGIIRLEIRTLYAVAATDLSDCSRNYVSYWTERNNAQADADRRDLKRKIGSVPCTVHSLGMYVQIDELGRTVRAFREIKLDEVQFDIPTVESVKAKLSDKELTALGITR